MIAIYVPLAEPVALLILAALLRLTQ